MIPLSSSHDPNRVVESSRWSAYGSGASGSSFFSSSFASPLPFPFAGGVAGGIPTDMGVAGAGCVAGSVIGG